MGEGKSGKLNLLPHPLSGAPLCLIIHFQGRIGRDITFHIMQNLVYFHQILKAGTKTVLSDPAVFTTNPSLNDRQQRTLFLGEGGKMLLTEYSFMQIDCAHENQTHILITF